VCIIILIIVIKKCVLNVGVHMSLNEMKKGQRATVTEVPEGELRHKLLRFGLAPGMKVRCHAKIPFGPVVVKFGGQEIALGRDIAKRVKISGIEEKK